MGEILSRSGRIVLPLEGKGNRSAVDEVTSGPFHCRGACFPCQSLLTVTSPKTRALRSARFDMESPPPPGSNPAVPVTEAERAVGKCV